MNKPLISVCIPVFNGAVYLKACLDSVVAQTFANFEVIICDDGSSDNSYAICEEYVKKYNYIKLFKNQVNLGLVGNWNTCIKRSEGIWIKFLFQDDLMNPSCLEEMAKHTQAEVELMVCKRNFLIDKVTTEDERDYYARRVRTLENTGYYRSNNFSADVISIIAANNPSMNFIAEPSLTMFRRISIEKVGMFDPELKQICDLEFFLRIASVFGLRYIPQQLCTFRIHGASTTEKNVNSNNYYVEHIEASLFALKLLTKPEFMNFRSYIGASGTRKLRMFIKFRTYKASKAAVNTHDERLLSDLRSKYGRFMYQWYDIPVLKLYLLLK